MAKKMTLLLTLALVLGGLTASITAQSSTDTASEASVGEIDRAALVAKLVDMPKDQRRAELEKMSAEDRRGLWFEIKKAQWTHRGAPVKNNAYTSDSGKAITAQWQEKGGGLVGTIAYDSGFASVAFAGDGLVGNRFDTHRNDGNVNPVSNPGTLSTVRAVVVPGSTSVKSSAAGFVLYGPQTTMGGAPALFSTFTSASGQIDSVIFSGLGVTNLTGSEFLVLFGDFASSYIPVLGTGTTLGQGHHAVAGSFGTTPDLAGTTPLTGLNAFIRVSGVLVPVELMSFQVD